PRVLLVPAQSNERSVRLGALVDDSGVLLVPEIKNPNGTISGDGGKDPNTSPGDVVDLLVMGNKLSIHGLPLNVPYGAGGVDAGGPDTPGLGLIPVEGGDWPAELGVLVAVEEAAELDAGGGGGVVGEAPDAEVVAGVLVGDEGGLGWGVGVVEGEGGVGADLAGGVVELDDLDAVGELLEEAGDGEAVLLVPADTPVHGVDVPGRLVGVDLRALLLLVGAVMVGVAARRH
ncbi:hypothetical protein CRG98_000371, partial [Punica granatum]